MKRWWKMAMVLVGLPVVVMIWFCRGGVELEEAGEARGSRGGSGHEVEVRSPDAGDPGWPEEAPTGERLLEGYGDPELTVVEDLRRIQRVLGGYYSVTKNRSVDPIGGNEDLAVILQGGGRGGKVWVRRSHRLFGGGDVLRDRWGRPLAVHPVGWQQIELRSAGEDGRMFSEDDVRMDATGKVVRGR